MSFKKRDLEYKKKERLVSYIKIEIYLKNKLVFFTKNIVESNRKIHSWPSYPKQPMHSHNLNKMYLIKWRCLWWQQRLKVNSPKNFVGIQIKNKRKVEIQNYEKK